jgi:epoxyqueuosine reductase QueG
MDEELGGKVSAWLEQRTERHGFAAVERFAEAPAEHHPAEVCRDAATIIVYAKPVPRGVLTSPSYGLHLLQRGYHTVYAILDQIGFELANLLETHGYPSVLVPSYAPMVFHGAEPWGLISLKHAAQSAGLGTFGRNRVIHNRDFGTMLRFGAVITAADIKPEPVAEDDPCPPGCTACIDACPSGALAEDSFQKMVCLPYSVKHGLYHHLLSDAEGLERIEMIINTSGYNYWLDCDECLKVCPNNREQNVRKGAR